MVYCPKCGMNNPEGARFCSSCGAALMGPPMHRGPGKEWDKDCSGASREGECFGSSRASRIFWGIIILLIGIWLLFEFGLKNIAGLPSWVYTFEFWWIFPIIIGIAIIIAAIRMMVKKN